ncbi:MAG: CPBP family intramembrane metalloprotease, partial [Streptococcus salivarius]|nr:CPBP family intramembrane metalloprotease [Streptococcus salivarius]
MSKSISKQSVAIWYALTALLATFIVGQVILCFFPDRSSMGVSLLFILMNLIPLIMAAVFSLVLSEIKSLGEFFKKVFLQNESHLSWILAIFIPVIYYGISILLMNVRFTGNSLMAFFLYLPWTFLYGGLEEVGWRWFLQEHLYFSKHFITKMMVLSIV